MASVGVSGHIFVDQLNTDLQTRAAICQHVAQVCFRAVVGSGLDGDADTFGLRLLGKTDGLGKVGARVSRQGVVQLRNEVLAVLYGQRHEGAAHDNVLDFVDQMAQQPELVDPPAGLLVRVVAGADGPHQRGLVARV